MKEIPAEKVESFVERIFVYDQFFRDGYSLVFQRPIGLANFLVLTYYVVLERVPISQTLFPHFYIYAIFGLSVIVAMSIIAGWWIWRRKGRVKGGKKKLSKFAIERILAVESNPQTAFLQKTLTGLLIGIYEREGWPVPEEAKQVYAYWKGLDDEHGWRPSR